MGVFVWRRRWGVKTIFVIKEKRKRFTNNHYECFSFQRQYKYLPLF